MSTTPGSTPFLFDISVSLQTLPWFLFDVPVSLQSLAWFLFDAPVPLAWMFCVSTALCLVRAPFLFSLNEPLQAKLTSRQVHGRGGRHGCPRSCCYPLSRIRQPGCVSFLGAYLCLFSLQPVSCVSCSYRGLTCSCPRGRIRRQVFEPLPCGPQRQVAVIMMVFMSCFPLRYLLANSQDLWMTSSSRAARERG